MKNLHVSHRAGPDTELADSLAEPTDLNKGEVGFSGYRRLCALLPGYSSDETWPTFQQVLKSNWDFSYQYVTFLITNSVLCTKSGVDLILRYFWLPFSQPFNRHWPCYILS